MKKIKSRKTKKYLKLKKILFLFIFIIFFYFSINVNAGIKDSNLVKKRIDNVYAIATIEGKERIFYLNIYEVNNRISYCIDLGVDITSSIYNSTKDFSISHLNEEQIEYIRSISYFGYGYDTHNDYKYYMAAQELIWEYLSGIDVNWVSEMNFDGKRIDISFYKSEILQLSDSYNQKLDFNWIDGQDYFVGEKIELTDNKGILSDYEITSIYSGIYIENNKLIIEVANAIKKDNIQLKRKNYYDYDSSLYYYEDSQRLISNGNYKDVEKNLSFNIKGLSLNVNVVDADKMIASSEGDATLKGAKYELYYEDDKLIGTYVTDENGYFKVDNLLSGNYKLKQIEASLGYIINDDVIEFNLNKNNYKLKVKEQIIYNILEIRKMYGSNGIYEPEANIKFVVCEVAGVKCYNIFTKKNGIALLRLPYGIYKVQQYNTTSGYLKVDDFIVEVNAMKDSNIIYNLVNEQILIKLKLINLEKGSNNKINLKGFSYKIKNKDTDSYISINGNKEFSCDDNGEVIVPKMLPYGNYILEKINVPDNILLNDEYIEFTIDDKTNFNLVDNNLVFDLNVYNEFIRGKVNVLTLKEKFYSSLNNFGYKKEYLSKSEIILVADEDISINNILKYRKGDLIYEGLSDEKGKITIDNLYLGHYCIINKISDNICFTLESKDNIDAIFNIEIVEELEKNNIIIHNKNKYDNSIEGTIFELLNSDNIVIYTGITNKDGIIKVNNLINDKYCIRQKKIDLKYKLTEEDNCFNLESDKNINFTNDVVTKELIKVPNTLSDSLGLYEFILILFMMIVGVFVYKKIFNSKLYR